LARPESESGAASERVVAERDADRRSRSLAHPTRITSLAFSGVWAAVRAGLGITVRTFEMLNCALRVLSESEGLLRLPNIGHDLYLRDERVSPPAQRLFGSVGEGGVRQTIRVRRARSQGRGKQVAY
jgi:hypothetical protein